MPINFENVTYQEMSLSLWALKHRERVLADGGTIGTEASVLAFLQDYWEKYLTLSNITYTPSLILGYKEITNLVKLYSLQEKFDTVVSTSFITGSTQSLSDVYYSGSTLYVEYADGNTSEYVINGEPDEYIKDTYVTGSTIFVKHKDDSVSGYTISQDLSNYVPYTGATTDVDLGSNSLLSGNQTIGSISTGANEIINATREATVTLSMNVSNWTLTSGWEVTNNGNTALVKNAAGVTPATYLINPPVANSRVLIKITASATFTGGFTYSYGNVTSDLVNPVIGDIVTVEQEFQLPSSGMFNLIITPAITTARFRIYEIVITTVSGSGTGLNGNGNLTVYGNIYSNFISAPGSDNGITIRPNGTIIFPGSAVYSGLLAGITTIDTTSTITTSSSALETPGIGFYARNAAVASGTKPIRVSPTMTFNGTTWNGDASVNEAIRNYLVPVTGATGSHYLTWENTFLNGVSSVSEIMRLDSNGNLTIPGNITANNIGKYQRLYDAYTGTTSYTGFAFEGQPTSASTWTINKIMTQFNGDSSKTTFTGTTWDNRYSL